MCRVLGVSKGGFYNWLKRPPSAREQEDGNIAARIVDIYQQHKGRYGSPRIQRALLQAEEMKSEETIFAVILRQWSLLDNKDQIRLTRDVLCNSGDLYNISKIFGRTPLRYCWRIPLNREGKNMRY